MLTQTNTTTFFCTVAIWLIVSIFATWSYHSNTINKLFKSSFMFKFIIFFRLSSQVASLSYS